MTNPDPAEPPPNEPHVQAPAREPPKSSGEMVGDALREIGVLLAVFGWLEPWHRGELTIRSFAGIEVIALFAFALGMLVERRR